MSVEGDITQIRLDVQEVKTLLEKTVVTKDKCEEHRDGIHNSLRSCKKEQDAKLTAAAATLRPSSNDGGFSWKIVVAAFAGVMMLGAGVGAIIAKLLL